MALKDRKGSQDIKIFHHVVEEKLTTLSNVKNTELIASKLKVAELTQQLASYVQQRNLPAMFSNQPTSHILHHFYIVQIRCPAHLI